MSQNARDRVIADFRAGRVPVLLATNVSARGLDVLSIEQVINYELPESAELFTHRVGRTGRMEREGEAITLIAPEDLLAWQKMQRDLDLRLLPRPWPHDEMPLPDAPMPVRHVALDAREQRVADKPAPSKRRRARFSRPGEEMPLGQRSPRPSQRPPR